MTGQTVFYFVAADCSPDVEDKFNAWFDDVHIPLLLKFHRLRSVTRYKLAQPDPPARKHYRLVEQWPKYLTTYEFDSLDAAMEYLQSPELEAARQEMQQTWTKGEVRVDWRVHYEFLGRRDRGS